VKSVCKNGYVLKNTSLRVIEQIN